MRVAEFQLQNQLQKPMQTQLQKEADFNQYQNIVTEGMQNKQEQVAAVEEKEIDQEDYADRQTDSDGDAVVISAEAKELFEESAEAGKAVEDNSAKTVSGSGEVRPNFTVEVNKTSGQKDSGAITEEELPESATTQVSTSIQGTGEFVQSTNGQDILAHVNQKGYNPFE